MNWKSQLFKPKWQHKDPGIRRKAVAQLFDPELIAALDQICLQDDDPGVRAAAARRVTDLSVLTRSLAREQDASAATAMKQRLFQLCSLTTDDRPSMEQRCELLQVTQDRDLLELLASTAPETEVRLLALKRTDRQGFLGDRAIEDGDATVRQAAARAINQHSTLRRVIDGTRKSDKVLHQALRDRLHQELLEAGDATAIDEEALKICLELEQYALKKLAEKTQADAAVPTEISAAWDRLAGRASDGLKSRYQHTVDRLLHVPEPEPLVDVSAPPASEEATQEAKLVAADYEQENVGESPDAVPSPLPALFEKLAAKVPALLKQPVAKRFNELKASWQTAWSSLATPTPVDAELNEKAAALFAELENAVESARLQREEKMQKAGDLLTRYAKELEDGALHKALESRHQLSALAAGAGRDREWAEIRQKMGALQGRLKELRDWQHWSNDTHRKQLIKEMEVLPQAGLHPDALLDRVQSLQKEWKALEESEQIPGEPHFSTAPWMWRKFKTAGNNAFSLAKPFLDKRSEIRKNRFDELKALVGQIKDAAAAETTDWPQLRKLVQAGKKEFSKLDDVPQKARHRAATMLKEALDSANTVIQANYEKIEMEKRKLIRAAQQLAHLEDAQEAIRTAKRLQTEWKAAGSLWRSQENRLWTEFRELLDPLFGKVKAEQESQREVLQQNLAAQKALCDELKEVLKLEDEQLAGAAGRVQGLKDGWRDLENHDRKLVGHFETLLSGYQKRVRQFEAAQANRVHQQWWIKSGLLHQLESAALGNKPSAKTVASILAKWPKTVAGDPLDDLLDARSAVFRDDLPELHEDNNTKEKARQFCIQLEFLAGLPSPEDEKDLRMKYQVDRLSESMAGLRERISAIEEARLVEREWLGLEVLNGKDHAAFEKRIKMALKEITEVLNV